MGIEYVLCVPHSWTATGSLATCAALQSAAVRTQFGVVDDHLERLFMVSEQEAAAEYILCNKNLQVRAICSLGLATPCD